MKIIWQGHACFRIETSGTSIVTDPYTPEVAHLTPMTEPADIVIRSSPGDAYHSCEQMVPGPHRLLEALEIARSGRVSVGGIEIEAFEVLERPRGGVHVPASNAMYWLETDGLRILHLGDIGHALTQDHVDRLRGRVDIMLAPTGDLTTIKLADLEIAIRELTPKVVIPMHYQIRQIKFPQGIWLYPVEAFVNNYSADTVIWQGSPELLLSPSTLPLDTKIYVLEAAGA